MACITHNVSKPRLGKRFKKALIAMAITFKLSVGIGKVCVTAKNLMTEAYWLLGGNQKRKKVKGYRYSNIWGKRYF